MGRSRKRSKRFRTKVSIRPKRAPRTKSKVPEALVFGRPGVAEKLGKQPEWEPQERLEENYKANGLVADPNAGFGRNSGADPLQGKLAAMEQKEDGHESDDDLRQLEGKARRDGRRADVTKPTATQRRVIGALLEAHGDDVEAMVRDTRLNRMLLPASKLKRLIAGFRKFGDSPAGRCGFRAPIKHL